MGKAWLAALLSALLPGIGQLMNRDWAKGLALLSMMAGLAVSWAAFPSLLTAIFLGIVFGFLWVGAIGDAYRIARRGPTAERDYSRLAVAVLLLTVGPFALPLLWQNHRFSRTAKGLWTAGVILLALLLIPLAMGMEHLMRQLDPAQRAQLEALLREMPEPWRSHLQSLLPR